MRRRYSVLSWRMRQRAWIANERYLLYLFRPQLSEPRYADDQVVAALRAALLNLCPGALRIMRSHFAGAGTAQCRNYSAFRPGKPVPGARFDKADTVAN